MTKRGALLVSAVFACAALGAASFAAERRQVSYDWKMRAAYPEIGIENIDADIAQWLQTHINAVLGELTGVEVEPDLPEMKNEIDVDYTLVRPSEHAVSVVFKTYRSPARAAHPMILANVRNYDLRKKAPLALEDLFGDPDAALAVMSREAPGILMEYIKTLTEDWGGPEDAYDESVLFPDGFAATRENFACLILEPEGVRAVFQQYQAMPYVFGLPEAFYPLSMLESAKPNLALWGK